MNAEQVTVYGGVGLAFQDVVAAWQIYRAALSRGLGREIDFLAWPWRRRIAAVEYANPVTTRAPVSPNLKLGHYRMATAKAEIPPAKGNQINDWPGRVRSVTGPFNFDPGPWSAIAFIILVSYNNSFHSKNALLE
jgi:hypothetical protein